MKLKNMKTITLRHSGVTYVGNNSLRKVGEQQIRSAGQWLSLAGEGRGQEGGTPGWGNFTENVSCLLLGVGQEGTARTSVYSFWLY